MAWTAEITGKAETNGALAVTVQYTDGTATITETIQTRDPNGDWPVPDIQARLKSLELVSTKPIEIGPVAPAVEVPQDAAAQAFAALATRARKLKRIVEFGITAAQADLDKAVADLNAAYKPEYESLI